MKFFLPLVALPLFVHAQASVSAPWDISQTIASLAQQTERLKPVLDQLTPQEWVKNGAPQAYVSQWQSAKSDLASVTDASNALEKQPEKLTTALNVYFRLQSLESRLTSLVDGVRKYQNPAVGDLIVGIVAENIGNRDKLREYLSDLAEQKEQEFSVVDQEAQRCRTTLNRQPAKPAPVKKVQGK
jgi:flagellar biosynthesis chaperone FliJ